ncbi:hypothetical protein BK703_15165 [Bacillus thuringiensis serovar silo]|nr:hypothetical protein BK703_15165 [Bacillus thuringiensis serovar silo]OTW63431.1 hypothetical protein BK700_17080 [Bacillus thuringiensis serovar toguchini]
MKKNLHNNLFQNIPLNTVGIYRITNLKNNKSYIGQSSDVKTRLYQHSHSLVINKHPNSHLQREYNDYPKKYFSFELLYECNHHQLNYFEGYFVHKHKSLVSQNGYNILKLPNFSNIYLNILILVNYRTLKFFIILYLRYFNTVQWIHTFYLKVLKL